MECKIKFIAACIQCLLLMPAVIALYHKHEHLAFIMSLCLTGKSEIIFGLKLKLSTIVLANLLSYINAVAKMAGLYWLIWVEN